MLDGVLKALFSLQFLSSKLLADLAADRGDHYTHSSKGYTAYF